MVKRNAVQENRDFQAWNTGPAMRPLLLRYQERMVGRFLRWAYSTKDRPTAMPPRHIKEYMEVVRGAQAG